MMEGLMAPGQMDDDTVLNLPEVAEYDQRDLRRYKTPNDVVAHAVPDPSHMCPTNSEEPAPARHIGIVFAAHALAEGAVVAYRA
ncbi:unnamed protein product [Zymoseptoria tritici ST99CH_3D7]|uniref:Uncharacterized protein n=1 Tax=Zymoseptoria tritici (strain ST99CH_3D7) TaxID=1276538 RepID=A0A1X7S7N1_ZYMT9|nr:unnamed protein product [Zymoseptoria tritici ST99CH_3D7]